MKKIRQYIDEVSPLKFFITAAAVFGLLFILLTPPFEGADETEHFLRAYNISEGHMTAYTKDGRVGGILPDSLVETINFTTTNPTIPYATTTKYPEGKTHRALSIPLNPNKSHFTEFPPSSSYSPIPYIPAALAMFVTRIFGLAPVVIMYAARLADLVSWIALIGLAIKLMPGKRWAMAFLGLFPMALFQASIVNTDVMAIGTLAVFLAYILYLRSRKAPIGRTQLLSLVALGSIMTLSKQIMFVFLPLVLLLKASQYKTKAKSYLSIAAVGVIPIILFGLWMLVIRNLHTDYALNTHPNPHYQLHHIIFHPLSYVRVIWDTYFYTTGDSIVRSFVGYFGWFDTPLPEAIVTLAYIAMAVVLLATPSRIKAKWMSRQDKLLILAIGLLYWIAVNTSLYVYYSPAGMGTIFGIQGRYFLPLTFLAIPLLYGDFLKTSWRNYRLVATLGPITFLTASVITIFVRYY